MTAFEKRATLEALARLLDSAPDFGEVGIKVHLHGTAVDRIEELRAEARKAEPRGPHA
jgi:hypothetical protein